MIFIFLVILIMVIVVYIINLFLFYSIFGNLFERVCMYFIERSYVSGFMGSIFTPIYGVGMLLISYIHDKIKINNKIIKIIVEFFIYAICLSLIELIGGVLIEKIFNKVYWNYDNYKYNIGIYIRLETAIMWGIISLVALYIIHPLFKKLEKHIPKFVTVIVSIIFIINLIFALIVK